MPQGLKLNYHFTLMSTIIIFNISSVNNFLLFFLPVFNILYTLYSRFGGGLCAGGPGSQDPRVFGGQKESQQRRKQSPRRRTLAPVRPAVPPPVVSNEKHSNYAI